MTSFTQNLKLLVAKPATAISAVALVVFASYFFASHTHSKKQARMNPGFARYMAAYTAGTISKESSIRIQLAGNFRDSSKAGAETDVFSFEPDIKGKAKWIDASTIEFKPEQPMPSATKYEAVFHLNKIIDVPDELETFPFQFNIVEQSFEIEPPVFESMDRQTLVYQRVSGTLLTADVEEDKNVEQLLKADQEGTFFHIRWEHAADKRTHRYMIDSVPRKTKPGEISISWDGTPLGLSVKGAHKLLIPALGDFKVMNITVQNDGEQYVSILFSDPLLASQDLNGLISFAPAAVAAGSSNTPSSNSNISNIELRFTIIGNEVKCYPGVRLLGTHILSVNQGIRNVLDYPLPDGVQQPLDFADMLPSASFIGKGVIMPASNRLMLPFEAVGLNAVDITVVKIYENNVAQFLQVNDLEGNREMVRVGRPVKKKTMRLDTDRLIDLRKPNRFAIELDKLIRTEPGAVYNVKITYKKAYSLYRCDTSGQANESTGEDMQTVEENWDDMGEQGESSYWDSAEDYYSEDFNWSERDNPCHNSYYNPQRWASRNIMASDLGIIAKRGANDDFIFAVTDLNSTKPVPGVTLNLLDFQQQVISSVTTNREGMAQVPPTARKPYLLVARYNEQRGYLKLDDGSSLSLSHFDVSGDIVQKGLKGFLYGERGVWRPGDSIYLTFMLEDRNKTLPPAHPVSFDLYDPNGVLYKRMVEIRSVDGFYSFRTSTDVESPTGAWTAKIKVGSATFQKTLRVETVMPNRLKIEMNFAKPYLQKDEQISTRLRSRWLHGAIADGLEAKVDVTLTPATTAFKNFSEYVFDDPTRRFSAETQTVFEGKLDRQGEASIKADIHVENRSAGMLNANFTTKVFEAGGNFSVDRFSIPFHPYENYIGIKLPKGDKARGMLLTDTNHTVSIVCVNPDGSLARGKKTVKVNLYKINWRWWWDKSDEDISAYAENSEYESLQEAQVVLNNGTGNWTLRVNYPSWGRYLLRVSDEDGHSTGKVMYMDWPGWAGRAQRENAVEATMLTFTSDKSAYKVGEEARLSIPTAKGGRALVSIESGTNVIETHWVEAAAGQTNYAFRITRSMMPNIFVHVTLVQPHAQTENDLPIRLYGMIPITVEDPATILKPVISMASQLRPDEASAIHVSEATGKPMTYTLAVVDEGLLDLTRFKTPSPHNQFYAREALGVKTWDMYDFVMGAFGMQMNRILSIGGDEGINKKAGDKKANRFKPVVKFLGPFHLEGGKTASHSITIENYVGSVRVMVVAGYDGAYGAAEKAVPVKKPLMVLATLPRVLGPGETVKLPVTVFAMEKNIRTADIRVEANSFLQLTSGSGKTVRFSRPGDEVVGFDVKIKNALGIGKVKVIASSGNEHAEYEIEIDIRNPNPYVSNAYEGIAEADRSWSTKYVLSGMNGTNTAMLEVSAIPALNLEKRLRYLITYPHGCVEQTTSAVFPQLALNDLLDLSTGWKKEIERNITAGIQKLRTFQAPDGGMAYWPGEGFSDEWASSYAGHFMLEAQQAGYSLPVSFMPNWKKYQRNKALTWTSYDRQSNDVVQAYRLYTLALAKAPELGAMNRLKELKNLTSTARWRLAATYVLIGQKDIAQQLIGTQPVTVNKYQEMDMTYGSDTRDEAMILETLVLMGDKARAGMVMERISKHLGSNEWMSTQTTAYALIAIAQLTGKFAGNKALEFSYTINGQAGNYRSNARIAQIPVKAEGHAAGNVQVMNKSGQLLYTRLITRGQPQVGDQGTAANNLQLEVAYKTMDGRSIDPSVIPQGTDFKAEVTITNPGLLGTYEQMALSQIFPSGWEIHNTRMNSISADQQDDPASAVYNTPRYQDIRDDRVYSYFSLPAKQKVTYVVLLNASYLGKFYLPSISCEAMYNGRISARVAGRWVEVVPRRSGQPVAMK